MKGKKEVDVSIPPSVWTGCGGMCFGSVQKEKRVCVRGKADHISSPNATCGHHVGRAISITKQGRKMSLMGKEGLPSVDRSQAAERF